MCILLRIWQKNINLKKIPESVIWSFHNILHASIEYGLMNSSIHLEAITSKLEISYCSFNYINIIYFIYFVVIEQQLYPHVRREHSKEVGLELLVVKLRMSSSIHKHECIIEYTMRCIPWLLHIIKIGKISSQHAARWQSNIDVFNAWKTNWYLIFF